PFGLDLLLDACSQILRVLVGFEGDLTLSLFDADLDFHGAPCRFSMADDDLACVQPNVSRRGFSSRSIPLWADMAAEGMSSGRGLSAGRTNSARPSSSVSAATRRSRHRRRAGNRAV